MLAKQRLAELEEILNSRYETLSKAEKRLAITDEIFAKDAIEQRIRKETLPEIRKYEAEYWQLLRQFAPSCTVEEVDASNAIVHVVQEVELIENKPNIHYSDEFRQRLLQIRDKLNEPGTAASAKVKLALPLIPGILSYELELDTENALRRALQPIRELFRKK